MKKIFTLICLFIFFNNPAYGDKLLKNGFINKRLTYAKDQNIIDRSNTIIIIYNHGQDKHDIRLKNCSWKNNLRNSVSLLDTKVNGKQIMVYNLCSNDTAGDDKNLWNKKKFKPPYKGKSKLEKRLDANLDLINQFVNMGVPNKQIILTGHSCGGWMTLMLMSRYSDKVGGAISYMPACYGKLTKNFKVKKIGVEKALEKFKKKDGSGPADMRQAQINEIKKSKNLPVLVFTHPKDPFDGLLSDWVEEIPGVKRIIISEGKKVNGKTCSRIGINDGKKWKEAVKNMHYINWADCFQYFNPLIIEYIKARTL